MHTCSSCTPTWRRTHQGRASLALRGGRVKETALRGSHKRSWRMTVRPPPPNPTSNIRNPHLIGSPAEAGAFDFIQACVCGAFLQHMALILGVYGPRISVIESLEKAPPVCASPHPHPRRRAAMCYIRSMPGETPTVHPDVCSPKRRACGGC